MENREQQQKGKGLTDKHDSEITLNESGTSVSLDHLQNKQAEAMQADNEQTEKKEIGEMEKGKLNPRFDITDPA